MNELDHHDGIQDKMDRSYDRVQRVNCRIKTSRFAAFDRVDEIRKFRGPRQDEVLSSTNID